MLVRWNIKIYLLAVCNGNRAAAGWIDIILLCDILN